MRIGMIGLGSMGHCHHEVYKKLEKENPDIQVRAYCDIRPDALEYRQGAAVYLDIAEFLNREQGKLDYVDICLPTDLHAKTAVAAMEKGFHVLCEKPMAIEHASALSMCEAAHRCGRTLMIAQCMRFNPYMRVAERYIRSGELGTAQSASFTRYQGVNEGTSGWFLKPERSGGALLDLHVHDVDLVQFFFGMPESVSAVSGNWLPGSAYDSVAVNYLYPSGFYVRGASDWTLEHNRFETRTFRVNFSDGYLFNDRGDEGRAVFVAVKKDGTTVNLMGEIEGDEYENEIRYFIGCLQGNKPVERCLPESTAESIRLVMAEKASADRRGEVVRL